MLKINNITLVNFKNFSNLELEFSPKINCFIGNNGTGKTNILDSIHYLSFCKSLLNLKDSQNIKNGESFFIIEGNFTRFDEPEHIYCGFNKEQKKSFRRNGVEYKKLSEHIGLLPVVFTNPNDSDLIYLGSEIRRKFVDVVISQFDKNYLNSIIKYNKILEQRNSLLKNPQNPSYENFEAWDFQLANIGEEIFHKRMQFIKEISEIFQKYYSLIGEEREKVALRYFSNCTEKDFTISLKNGFEKDKILGYTSFGVHRDDFEFSLDGFQLKKYASQGQQKSYIISLKFAQFEYIKNKTGLAPILLLDDIFDKLDKTRVKNITGMVSKEDFGQIFITDTSRTRMPDILKELDIEQKTILLGE
ncbi:MAG TPA: DNA replication and repair protein RecF [Bacteroidales bacterium]|nr:DNA replication and repair protein RecF [Bacteroidales bacterium]HOL98951.1 DNA replication and repair protein RecF [Bacteroidales bacterium]HPD24183.1 DNA replication and repair protein RecF [Bacteroidales bacterium]